MFQPPNSPDVKVLDLGLFAVMQLLQYHESPTNIEELIFDIEQSFEEILRDKLSTIFLSVQAALKSVMNGGG